MLKIGKEELKVRNRYERQFANSNFIFSNLSNLRGVCYDGYKAYLKKEMMADKEQPRKGLVSP